MTKKENSANVTIQKSRAVDSVAETVTRLNAQKILALQAGKTKAAGLIQKIIDALLRPKNRK